MPHSSFISLHSLITDPAPCGTPRGYRAHLRRREPPCGPCREANTAAAHENRAELEERERDRKRRISGYGVVKETQLLSALPLEEQEEYRRIQRRKRRSAGTEQRMRELGSKAHELHARRQADPRTPDNDLHLYAQQVGGRMRARQAGRP
jgi:hypothetical protein